MIDIQHEQLVRLKSVAKLLPPNERTRQTVHISAIHRWVQRGRLSVSGRRVKLETLKIGGSTFTSVQAVQRFADRLSAPDSNGGPPDAPMAGHRQKQVEAASREVARMLGAAS